MDFLDAFFKSIPATPFSEIIFGESKLYDINSYTYLSELIFNNSELYVDDIKAITNQAIGGNPFYIKLLKNSQTGGSIIKDSAENFPDINNDHSNIVCQKPNSIFLHVELTAKYQMGWCMLNSLTWKKVINSLSSKITLKVDKNYSINEFKGWSFLNEISLPINAAIIADNFIMDKPETYEFNIFSIIEKILPEELDNIDFDLAIITKRDLVNPRGKWGKLNTFIKEIRKKYVVNLSIFCTPSDEPHDRDIITNYFRVHSGHSLDYYNKNNRIAKDTTIQFSGLNCSNDNTHRLLLNNYVNVTSRAKKEFDLFGSGEHRLLRK